MHRAATDLKMAILAEMATHGKEWGLPIRVMEHIAPREMVRGTLKTLRDEGLVEFHRNLWTDDGEMAGAGYFVTEKGMQAIETARKAKAGLEVLHPSERKNLPAYAMAWLFGKRVIVDRPHHSRDLAARWRGKLYFLKNLNKEA